MGAYVSTPEAASPQVPHKMPEPRDHTYTHSRQSSISSESSGASASSAQRAVESSAVTEAPPTTDFLEHPLPPAIPASQMDPLSREYPKPTEEVNVSEMLKRTPMKWTLGHYIKETPIRKSLSPREDREQATRNLEDKKNELLKAKEEMRKLSIPK